MTKYVSTNDRDKLKELATEIGLDFPNNIPTNKLIDQINEKIEQDGLDIVLGEGDEKEVAPTAMSAPARAVEKETETMEIDILPLNESSQSIHVVPENVDGSELASISNLKSNLKVEAGGTNHNLTIKYFTSGNPSDMKEYDVESGISYVMVKEGETLGFEATATADIGEENVSVDVNADYENISVSVEFKLKDTTAPLPPTDVNFSENGSKISGKGEPEADVEVVDSESISIASGVVDTEGSFELDIIPALTDGESVAVFLTDASGNVSESVSASAPIINVEPEPEPDPEPEPEPKPEFVHGINLIEGTEFYFDSEKDHAMLQLTDNLLRAIKLYNEPSDEDLLKIESIRLVKEYKFLKKIQDSVKDYDTYDVRFNNMITKEQLESLDFYHDVETLTE